MTEETYTSFYGFNRIGAGTLTKMLKVTKTFLDQQPEDAANAKALLIFHDPTGRQVDFDFRGSLQDILARVVPPEKPSGPGRPKLGVTSREVTLLPRHWLWLESQPGGISASLRRLVDEARKREPDEARIRRTLAATDRFMLALAGDLPGYEEASRALYARDRKRLEGLIKDWPEDVRTYILSNLTER